MLENKGKTVGDVSLRRRKRKLNVLKDNALKALSFVGSFGLTVHSLIADTISGKKVELSLIDHADVLQVLYLFRSIQCKRQCLSGTLSAVPVFRDLTRSKLPEKK